MNSAKAERNILQVEKKNPAQRTATVAGDDIYRRLQNETPAL
jgi:hypothetical protein